MSIDIVAEPHMQHQEDCALALSCGLSRHGIETRIVPTAERATSAVVACWGWCVGAPLRTRGREVLVMERGYLGDRSEWTSIGWNGLNGHARFSPMRDTGRFETLFAQQWREWDSTGDYALLIGQVDGDSSLHGMAFADWAEKTASEMRIFGLPVKFRPHPEAVARKQRATFGGAETLFGSLADALRSARVVVTFNSNAGVDALIAGKPTVALHSGSMAWGVAATAMRIQAEPDRAAWAGQLAWNQFSLDEMRSGFAWEHVRAGPLVH